MNGGLQQSARILQASMADAGMDRGYGEVWIGYDPGESTGDHTGFTVVAPLNQAERLVPFDARAELLHGLWIMPLFALIFAAAWIMTP